MTAPGLSFDRDYFLYVVEMDDCIKVGRTGNVKRRAKTHRIDAERRGSKAIRCWRSDPHAYEDVKRGERALIKLCARRWPVAWGAEYFHAPFEDAVELMGEVNQALLLLTCRFDQLDCDVFAA